MNYIFVLSYLVLSLMPTSWLSSVDETRSSVEHVAILDGAKAGVDDQNALWFWDPRLNLIHRIPEKGIGDVTVTVPPALSVDADTRRGILALTPDGTRIQLITWGGQQQQELTLPEPSADVAWLTGSLVATTPIFGDHRVEIWDLDTGTLLRTIGPSTRISDKQGRHLGRATRVRYNLVTGEIVAFDGTFGHVYVFGLNGELRRNRRLVTPSGTPTEWTSTLDLSASEQGSTTFLLWNYPAIAVAADGRVWIVSDVSATGVVGLASYDQHGDVQTVEIQISTCPAMRVQPWRNGFVFFRDSRSSHPPCATFLRSFDAAVNPTTKLNVKPEPACRSSVSTARFVVARPNATAPYPCTWCSNPDPEVNGCECPNVPDHRYSGSVCSCTPPYCKRICIYDPPL